MPSPDKLLRQLPLRLPALALALTATAGVSLATAQTVIVRSAPAGATIELTLEGGRSASATADNFGDATLVAPASTAEGEAQMYVDACGTTVRVMLLRLRPGSAQPGCTRTEIGSIFRVGPLTTFVVDMDDTRATAHVTQGPPPRSWVDRGATPEKPKRNWGTPQKGLTLSGGAGFSKFSNATNIACGDVSACNTHNFGLAFAAGADYWIRRFAAAHVGYVKPADVTTNGGSGTYRFDSELKTRLVFIGGKLGGATGPARVYGLGGVTHHQAVSTTNQTFDPTTVVVDGVTQTIPGGTQSYAQKTQGWSWYAGGGAEGWVFNRFAIFGEVMLPKVKGAPTGGGEGGIDDRVLIAVAGVRVRIGGF
jgi:hypothetical protein